MIFNLLIGILGGAAIFAATLFSIYQAVVQSGRLQWAHIATVGLTLAGMGTITWLMPATTMVIGGVLALAALLAMLWEVRWNRLLPLFQLLFAFALITGLPFNFV